MALMVPNRTFATPLCVISAPTEKPDKPHLEDLGKETKLRLSQDNLVPFHHQVDLNCTFVAKIHDEHLFP